jgi:hypothetical protein
MGHVATAPTMRLPKYSGGGITRILRLASTAVVNLVLALGRSRMARARIMEI